MNSNVELLLTAIVAQSIIIGLLCYIKIYISFTYQRDGSNDYIAVNVYTARKILEYSMEIPIIEITGIKNAFWLESKVKTGLSQERTNTKREQRFVKKTVKMYITHPRKLRAILRIFRSFVDSYYRFMNKIATKLCCEQLQWKSVYGSEDAAITGIGTGLLWTIKALIITRLKKNIIYTKNPIISVSPVFGQNSLKVDFQCIFSIRLGNVINAMRVFYEGKR